MASESWWELTPVLEHHYYWHQKEKFLLDSDRYPHWTMFAVAGGKFEYDILGSGGTARLAEIVLCPPETDFGRRVTEVLSFHFLAFSFIRPDGTKVTELPGLEGYKLEVADTQRLFNTFGHLRSAAMSPGSWVAPWSDHLLKDLWKQFAFERLQPASSGFGQEKHRFPDDPVMDVAGRIIQEQACTPLSLAGLAERLGLTPVQLTRRYKAVFGLSPSEHVLELRMRHACSLLTGTTFSLDTIAEACGYETGFYLSRIFTKKMGMSPSAYRKAYRI
jgi:AraC family transcriptional regulator